MNSFYLIHFPDRRHSDPDLHTSGRVSRGPTGDTRSNRGPPDPSRSVSSSRTPGGTAAEHLKLVVFVNSLKHLLGIVVRIIFSVPAACRTTVCGVCPAVCTLVASRCRPPAKTCRSSRTLRRSGGRPPLRCVRASRGAVLQFRAWPGSV